MSNQNREMNRVVWVDVPVRELERACQFYAAVLDIEVEREEHEGLEFGVLEHGPGNGGCLVPQAEEISADQGIVVYFGVEGRIREAITAVREHGGVILEEIHAIGPHGVRALVLDSEGNRIALHATRDT